MNKLGRQVHKINYQPDGSYPYDLEVFRVSELRRRTSHEGMRLWYGYTFYMLILVTEGRCVQSVDFEPRSAQAGSLVVIHPGQAHNFGDSEAWDGWIVLVRPEFLWPTATNENLRSEFQMECLPGYLEIDEAGLARTIATFEWMQQDAAQHPVDSPEHTRQYRGRSAEWVEYMQAHLRYTFYALVSWLVMNYAPVHQVEPHRHPAAANRFHLFKDLVEQHLLEWKAVSTYATAIGCTERSLTRAVLDAEGISAKVFLSRRLALEAKRLLIHTDWSIGAIGDRLGFREATHFSKFFRRETGSTPQHFRATNKHN